MKMAMKGRLNAGWIMLRDIRLTPRMCQSDRRNYVKSGVNSSVLPVHMSGRLSYVQRQVGHRRRPGRFAGGQ